MITAQILQGRRAGNPVAAGIKNVKSIQNVHAKYMDDKKLKKSG
jgi:hypothetical protein